MHEEIKCREAKKRGKSKCRTGSKVAKWKAKSGQICVPPMAAFKMKTVVIKRFTRNATREKMTMKSTG